MLPTSAIASPHTASQGVSSVCTRHFMFVISVLILLFVFILF